MIKQVMVGAMILTAALLTVISDNMLKSASALAAASCNCAIFRFDDVQGWWEHDVQNTVLTTFIQIRAKVTPALVMDEYGDESRVVDTVKEGQRVGLFEVALHGWNHDDFALKTVDEQKADLIKSNTILEQINGVKSNIFVAPYDSVNSNMLLAMKDDGLQILSADAYGLPDVFPQIDKAIGIANIPYTVNFVNQNKPLQSNGKTMRQIITEINASISQHGYAVVLTHPQDFALYDSHGNEPIILPQINSTQLSTLKAVISQLRANSIPIASFNELTGLSYPSRLQEVVTQKTVAPQQQQQQQLSVSVTAPNPAYDLTDQTPGMGQVPTSTTTSGNTSSPSINNTSSDKPSLSKEVAELFGILGAVGAMAMVLLARNRKRASRTKSYHHTLPT
jgi:peptidoglycan/xylan/chitin deacetylase (PgdA/CDA1 family)